MNLVVEAPTVSSPDIVERPSEPGLFLMPPAPECEAPLGKPLTGLADSLFQPLSKVRLSGSSTDPPRTTEANDIELDHPLNDACAYIGTTAPGYYSIATHAGMQAPYRNAFPFCHRPLYFEDPNLERCGASWGCLTTTKSAAVLAGQILAMPVKVLVVRPRDHVHALPDCPTCHRFGHDAYCSKSRKCECR